MHVMRIRRALKKLSFVKSEHRVRGEKWEKDCGGGDITGRLEPKGTGKQSRGINASKQLSGKQRKSAAWLQAGMRCLFNQ